MSNSPTTTPLSPNLRPAHNTSPLRTLPDDRQPVEDFRDKAAEIERQRLQGGIAPRVEKQSVSIIDWDRNKQNGSQKDTFKNLAELTPLGDPEVRVIFARQDLPLPERKVLLTEIFEKYSIPGVFISEGLQNVSQSFGVRKNDDGTEYIWFHFLMKDVALSQDRSRVVDPTNTSQSQANFTWIKPGFVLQIDDPSKALSYQSKQNSSGSLATLTPGPKRITLLCFGAPRTLHGCLTRLRDATKAEDLKADPYILLDVVFEDMFRLMDNVGWILSDIFGKIETETLGNASSRDKAGKDVDFTGLHNLAKHTIYLRENCDSALATLGSLYDHHKSTVKDSTPQQEATRRSLEYRKTMFQSTQRRLESLDKRMANILQLSFHLVTQRDSQSMKTIAVMTLLFMPLGTVAAIFGTQLIKLKDEKPYHMELSRDFWLIFAISVPLTIFVVVIWRLWYRDAKTKVKERSTGYWRLGSFKERFDRARIGQKPVGHTV